MVKMALPKLVPPGTDFLINKDPLELIFAEKYGLFLKHLHHLPEMNNVDPGAYLTCKIWTGGVCRKASGNYSDRTQCTVVSAYIVRSLQRTHVLDTA